MIGIALILAGINAVVSSALYGFESYHNHMEESYPNKPRIPNRYSRYCKVSWLIFAVWLVLFIISVLWAA